MRMCEQVASYAMRTVRDYSEGLTFTQRPCVDRHRSGLICRPMYLLLWAQVVCVCG